MVGMGCSEAARSVMVGVWMGVRESGHEGVVVT